MKGKLFLFLVVLLVSFFLFKLVNQCDEKKYQKKVQAEELLDQDVDTTDEDVVDEGEALVVNATYCTPKPENPFDEEIYCTIPLEFRSGYVRYYVIRYGIEHSCKISVFKLTYPIKQEVKDEQTRKS